MTRSSKIKQKVKNLNGRKSHESFVQIPKYMKESSGYKHLVLNCTGALTIYIDLADRYNGINNVNKKLLFNILFLKFFKRKFSKEKKFI